MEKIDRPESRQPIPANAKVVFSGELFDIIQWNQKQFDGTIKIFEKIRRPDTVYVIPINKNGKMIICRQSQPGSKEAYGLLGGRVENNENVSIAARRELYEESGISVEKLTLWKSFQFLPKLEWAIYVYIGENITKQSRNLDSGERIELVEVSLEELIEIAASQSFGDMEIALLLLRTFMDKDEYEILKSFTQR